MCCQYLSKADVKSEFEIGRNSFEDGYCYRRSFLSMICTLLQFVRAAFPTIQSPSMVSMSLIPVFRSAPNNCNLSFLDLNTSWLGLNEHCFLVLISSS